MPTRKGSGVRGGAPSIPGFNGAASLPTRKVMVGALAGGAVFALQWGRVVADAEGAV